MNKSTLSAQLSRHEGKRLSAYYCPTGHLTIGVGHNLEADPALSLLRRSITEVGETISEEECSALLEYDLGKCETQLRRQMSAFDTLSDPRQHVLLDMAFNMGISGLMEFKRMLAAINRADYSRAASEMLDSRWAEQVGQRAKTLARMMETNREYDAV